MLFQHTPQSHTRISHLDDQIYGTIAQPLLRVNSLSLAKFTTDLSQVSTVVCLGQTCSQTTLMQHFLICFWGWRWIASTILMFPAMHHCRFLYRSLAFLTWSFTPFFKSGQMLNSETEFFAVPEFRLVELWLLKWTAWMIHHIRCDASFQSSMLRGSNWETVK